MFSSVKEMAQDVGVKWDKLYYLQKHFDLKMPEKTEWGYRDDSYYQEYKAKAIELSKIPQHVLYKRTTKKNHGTMKRGTYAKTAKRVNGKFEEKCDMENVRKYIKMLEDRQKRTDEEYEYDHSWYVKKNEETIEINNE